MSVSKTIRVPASTANLGAGFDTLALAFKLYLNVEIRESEESGVQISSFQGEGAEIDLGHENLILRVIRRVYEKEGKSLPNIKLDVSNQIPLQRGLGSSSAAIVAGIGCYEGLIGELTHERFFEYALELKTIQTTSQQRALGV